MITIDSKYETLQRKKTSDEVENNSAAEYMEIEAISSEYINLNLKQSYLKNIDILPKEDFK